ncbi:MAG: DUF3857 and transglutaminase domain-containing protein [Bacteroidota bacterium]
MQDRDNAVLGEALAAAETHDATEGLEQLLHRVTFKVREGQVEKRVRLVWRYGSADAVQADGNDNIYFDATSQIVEINHAATIRADGKVRWLAPDDIEVVDYQEDYAVYTETKRISLLLPGLAVGSLSVLDYTVITDLESSEFLWSDDVYVQMLLPKRRLEIVVDWEPSLAVDWTREVEFLDCEATANSLRCLGNDIPKPEVEDSVNWYDELPVFVVTLASDWQEIADRARQAFDAALDTPGAVTELVRELTRDADGEEERFEAIYDFVASSIRYVSRSTAGHRVTPHLVSETAANRYGDCKDKSALLVALLREIGVDAWPVLVSTDRSRLTSVPIAGDHYFNHMIVCMGTKYGRTRCVDPTDPYTHPNYLTASVQGAVSLPLVERTDVALLPHARHRWRMEIDTDLRFDAQGNQTEEQERRYVGEYAGFMRSFLSSMTQDERTSHMAEDYTETVSELGEPTFEFDDVTGMGKSLAIRSKNVFEEVVDANAPLRYSEGNIWLRDEIYSVYPSNESYGWFFPGLRVTSRYHFDYDKAWTHRFAAPSLALEHRFGSLKQTVEEAPGGVDFTATLDLPSRRLAAEELEDFRAFLDLLSAQSNMRVFAKRR